MVKLQQFATVGSLLNLQDFYFSGSSQVVVLNQTRSDPEYTGFGVPKVSLLGLLVFTPMYVNDIDSDS